ncbi:hypothetical protein TPHA_0H03120 [Tetrapisispora phaffii CBS 4417]|uniref:Glutathione peroxidase n=1 Tax=Tetrapisispora phaffii (strain ATCC 24235 / CBS 4417 / NBRC 1672 / NRRL Y-8282 / UCD 70-5) TaxID=1071381 RepID=G8BWR4_TETPH|nr:hypothetical protein TPHA_0H03120 [Tetrapisispora phaffii CBS 4417]CCE64515.1 hypothetical protein TPHA_0H03120 [Tetrapisispora phaffii CBS 4417]
MSFYELSAVDINGEKFSFETLKGKVVLIVNMSSQSGLDPQCKELNNLYRRFKESNFVIIGFISDQLINESIMNQPSSPSNVIDEVTSNLMSPSCNVEFLIMDNIDVNGPNTDPVFKFLKERKKDSAGFQGIKWNFAKFLIDSNGNVVKRFHHIFHLRQCTKMSKHYYKVKFTNAAFIQASYIYQLLFIIKTFRLLEN